MVIPIADILSISEVRLFNGKALIWKRGFELNLEDGQRVGLAVPEPFGKRWRASLSRGGLADLSLGEAPEAGCSGAEGSRNS